jgi:hypothetical protein
MFSLNVLDMGGLGLHCVEGRLETGEEERSSSQASMEDEVLLGSAIREGRSNCGS